MTRQYRKFSDLDAVFSANPNTGDIPLRKDSEAIKFAIKNLILTNNYERPFDSSIGSPIRRMLFELMDDTTIITMKQIIQQTIDNHEPRVDVINIEIDPDEDHNTITISVNFKIKNTEQPINVTIALDRTR